MKYNYKLVKLGSVILSYKLKYVLLSLLSLFLLMSCSIEDDLVQSETNEQKVTPLTELVETENFKSNALEHILEGELNYKGQAVGFHYSQLESKKGEIIDNSQTELDENEVYEAKVRIKDVNKTSNNGKSTFFPDDWDTQDVVDAINEAYDNRTHINGNTFEGLTAEGIIVRMYLTEQNQIISAFPVYEGGG